MTKAGIYTLLSSEASAGLLSKTRIGKGKWYFTAFSSTNCNEITF